MIIRKFTRIILGAALGISVFAFAGNVPKQPMPQTCPT